MAEITTQQIKAIQTMISKDANMKAAKEDIVRGASKGRTSSVKELSFDEAKGLIGSLKLMQPAKVVDKTDPCHKMRGKILSMAHELGWRQQDGKGNLLLDEKGKPKVDYERVNNWCIQYGHAHKRLDKHTAAELTKLVWQFKQAYKDFLKAF